MSVKRFNARGRRGEEGNVVVIVLVILMIIAVFGAAVLQQQSNAGSAQAAYSKAREVEVTADAALDSAIQSIRYNPLAGINDTATGSTGLPCGNTTFGTTKYASYGDYDVYCQSAPTSGQAIGDAGEAPSTPLVALGGVLGTGNPHTDASALKNTKGCTNPLLCDPIVPPVTNPSTYIPNAYEPFCNDWEDTSYVPGPVNDTNKYYTGSPQCEAGIYIGATESDNDGGATRTAGFIVGSNGALNPSTDLVQSNGAIIVPQSTYIHLPRQLAVAGNVSARRSCGVWDNAAGTDASGSSLGTFYPDTHNNSGVFTNWPGTPVATHCELGGSSPLTPDPQYVHEPIDWQQIPRVDNSTTGQRCSNDDGSSAPCTLPTSGAGSLCDTGFVEMPAKQLVGPGGKVVLQSGKPVYEAWYDNATDLNNLMHECKDTLFWFRPGVYYFDFLDNPLWPGSGTSTAWNSPFSCWPLMTPNLSAGSPCAGPSGAGTDEILAGTPTQDLFAVTHQKLMTFMKQTPGNTWTNLDAGTVVDGHEASATATSATAAAVTQNYLESPIPQTTAKPAAISSVQSVKFQIAYKLPAAAGSYAFVGAFPGKRGGKVTLSIPDPSDSSSTLGTCKLYLPTGIHDKVMAGEPPQSVDSTDAAEQIDLSAGCSAGVATGVFKPGKWKDPVTGGWSNNPSWVNSLNAQFSVSGSSAVGAPVSLDGMQLDVAWRGRPAPQFPNGCDASKAGSQFIFGNTSRAWFSRNTDPGFQVSYSGAGSFIEMCASRQDTFPNLGSLDTDCGSSPHTQWCHLDGKGHELRIAVYGTSEDAAEPVQPFDTSSLAPQIQTNPDNKTVSFNPSAWPSDYAVPGDNGDANQGAASAVWGPGAPAAKNKAVLTFRLPSNLVCPLSAVPQGPCTDQIPYGSTIDSVTLTIKHREGSGTIAGGNFKPGVGIASDTLTIAPGQTPTGTGSNGYGTNSTWSSTGSGVNFPASAVCADSSQGFCTLTYGDPSETPPSAGNQNATPMWNQQQSLTWLSSSTPSLSSPEGINGALFTWTVTPSGNGQYEADVDDVSLHIAYRPTGGLRPLSGCNTLRTAWKPGNTPPNDPALTNPFTALSDTWAPLLPANADPSNPTSYDPRYDWLDRAWGPLNTSTWGFPYQTDHPFTDSTTGGRTFGNSPIRDYGDCAVFAVNGDLSIAATLPAHIQGMIYAPSGAVYMTGFAYDPSMTTDGITARQITALRWTTYNGSTPSIGGSSPPRNNRKVVLEVRDSSGQAVARAQVEFNDEQFQNLGEGVQIDSWIRNPRNPQ